MEGLGRVVVGSVVGGLLGAAAFFAVDAFVAKASSEPVYLRCDVPESGSPVWDLTLDEKAGTVAIYFPKAGASQKNDATFTRDEIRWSRPMPGIGSIRTGTYNQVTVVNRTTGKLVMDVPGLGAPPAYGSCAIQEAPTDRMF